MIRAVTGLPGEGKTCFAIQHVILSEVMQGNRFIYSNIEWHEDEVVKYCESMGYSEIDTTRLRLLNDDQIPRFWDHVSDDSLIVLDEVAEHFNSQSWKDIGHDAGTWARQHRKLGHEAYLVVQDLSHVYKQFRDLIAEEIKISNLSNRKFLGFRGPRMFLSRWVWRDSKGVSRSKIYKFDLAVFKTYNTLATIGGVLERGEVKKGKDSKQVKKKRSFWTFVGNHWMGTAVVCLLLLFIVPLVFLQGCFLNKVENHENVETGNVVDNVIDLQSGRDRRRKTGSPNLGRYDSTDKRRP